MPVTVMIVDDSKLARIVASKALSELQPDWSKVEAGSAAEALRIIEEEDIHIALIDFNMSEKDGLELAGELRVLRPNMPLAIITANVQDEIIARARAVGAGFVAKPVTADGLEPFGLRCRTEPSIAARMIPESVALTELQRDALTEIVNIGVSRAASNLRKMIDAQVFLSVPSIEVVSQRRAARLISEREVSDLVAVRQDFEGAFEGRALLIFPESNSLELVRAVTGNELSTQEVIDFEVEALAETGNVILNSCLATMANMLKRSLAMSIPEVVRGSGASFFENDGNDEADGLVLFLYIDFAIRSRDIRGYIAMIMDLPSLTILKGLLEDFIVRVVGDEI